MSEVETEKFKSPTYRLAEHTIDSKDIDSLIAWLRSGPWLTLGPKTREFEERWARWIGTRHAVFVNSGSSANLLMYAALLESGRLPNRKVIVPAVSWATSVAPAIQLGFEPILCDADPDDWGLDCAHLESLLAEHRAAAVLGVHVLGVPFHASKIRALQDEYDFVLLEDACAATGSRFDGTLVGTFGAMSTMSFYFGHHLSTIEGGMICTDDPEMYELLLMLRSHGWAKDLAPAREAELAAEHSVHDFNRRFTFYIPGFNVRSTDLQAQIGLRQLDKVDTVVARRVENHEIYQERFLSAARDDASTFSCQVSEGSVISSISFAALAASREHRDRIGQVLADHRIETRPVGGGNMSRQPFWSKRYGSIPLAMADRIHDRGFHLPNNPDISTDDIAKIADIALSVSPR